MFMTEASSKAETFTGIRTQHLTKRYGKRTVVNGVDIEVHPGEIVGLLGPNGAGKTTTFYMIVGLVPASDGQVIYDNKDVTALPMFKRAQGGIGYLPQEASVFRKLSVEDNIRAIVETLPIARSERDARVAEHLAELHLTHLAKQKAFTLSGGERRRLEITRALVTKPRFILMDEPFSGVDPISVSDVQSIIVSLKARGIGILIMHRMRALIWLTS
ncbi:MAG: LPS export ABC transporter ATP-binding protein [Verrucomicrobia bacterium 21-51-4]|nr:MAG: LPS export ABC transporter ATP-binding protein [Verrucomicrobia bacterium 21-51-4]